MLKRTKTLIKHCHCIAAPNGKPSSTSGLETAMHDDDCDYAVENKWRSNGTRRKLKISQLLARRVSAWRFCGGHYYLRAKKPNLLSHPFWKWRFFFSTFCSGSGQCFFLLEQKVFFLVVNKSCKGKWSIMHVQYFVKVAVMVLCYCYDYTICTVTLTGKAAITLLWDWGNHLFV